MNERGWGWAVSVGFLGALLLVLMSRGAMIHAVHYDELLHILSARGVLQTGQPAIADGFYTRAELFTRAVAWSYRHFGDNPVSARLPSLAAGCLLVFLTGAWVVRRAGLLAGTVAALLVCIVPVTVGVAVFARFYTVHALVMLLMFIASYEATQPTSSARTRLVAMGMAALLIPLGSHFQDTTIIAVGAVILAALALLSLDCWDQIRLLILRRPILTLGTLVVGAAAALATVQFSGLLYQLRKSALWAAGNADRYQYYLVEFRDQLPLLWPLMPAAVAIGVLHPAHRRLALFCAVAVASALLVHSVAAQKSTRYVYYLVPLMCVLWAIGLANVVATGTQRSGSHARGATRGSALVALVVLGAVFLLSQEGARALNLLLARNDKSFLRPYAEEPDWTSLVPDLEPRAQNADTVVTSNSMKALYYLGRYDYELNATIVPETETRAEFGRDRRTGRQAIGTADSIREVLTRPGETLVVIETSKIGRSSGVNEQAYEVIQSHCNELPLPGDDRVRAWQCAARH